MGLFTRASQDTLAVNDTMKTKKRVKCAVLMDKFKHDNAVFCCSLFFCGWCDTKQVIVPDHK